MSVIRWAAIEPPRAMGDLALTPDVVAAVAAVDHGDSQIAAVITHPAPARGLGAVDYGVSQEHGLSAHPAPAVATAAIESTVWAFYNALILPAEVTAVAAVESGTKTVQTVQEGPDVVPGAASVPYPEGPVQLFPVTVIALADVPVTVATGEAVDAEVSPATIVVGTWVAGVETTELVVRSPACVAAVAEVGVPYHHTFMGTTPYVWRRENGTMVQRKVLVRVRGAWVWYGPS